jgi:hypothetical protein
LVDTYQLITEIKATETGNTAPCGLGGNTAPCGMATPQGAARQYRNGAAYIRRTPLLTPRLTPLEESKSSEAGASGVPPQDDADTTSDNVIAVEAEPVPDDQRKRFDRQGAADDGMFGDILPPINIAIPEPRDQTHAEQLLWGPVRAYLASQSGATDASVRVQLGGLRKATGDNDLAIVRAAVSAQRTNRVNPLPWMRSVLNAKPGSRNGRSTASARDIFENLDQTSEEQSTWAN